MNNIMNKREEGEQHLDVYSKQCLILMALILIASGSLVIVLVVSLIPTYLPTKDISINNQNFFLINVVYTSNLINGSLLTIDEIDELRISLNNALHLYGINNLYGQFIPLYTNVNSRKKRATITAQNYAYAISSEDNIGDLLYFNFSVTYPKNNYAKKFRQRFYDEVFYAIDTAYTNFTLPIHFLNNILIDVKLRFCSFNDYTICQINCENNAEDTCSCNNQIELDENGCTCDDRTIGQVECGEVCSLDCNDEEICQD